MLFNLDRQLPVEHVKLEVGVEVVGQPLPLRLLETRKPSRTNFISCVQLIVFITTRRTTSRRNLCSSPSFVKTLTPHAPASLCQFTISMSEPCQMSFSLDFDQKILYVLKFPPKKMRSFTATLTTSFLPDLPCLKTTSVSVILKFPPTIAPLTSALTLGYSRKSI